MDFQYRIGTNSAAPLKAYLMISCVKPCVKNCYHTWNNPTRAVFFATFPPCVYILLPKVPTGVPTQLASDESVSLVRTSCCPETFFKAANHCFLECSSGANNVCAWPIEGLRKLTRNPFLPGWDDPLENADLNEPCLPFVVNGKDSLNEPPTLPFKPVRGNFL